MSRQDIESNVESARKENFDCESERVFSGRPGYMYCIRYTRGEVTSVYRSIKTIKNFLTILYIGIFLLLHI